MTDSNRHEIILIGPMLVGKTTVANAVKKLVHQDVLSLDAIRLKYFDQIGYDSYLASTIEEQYGLFGKLRYWKPFELYTVENVFSEYQNCIFDFGAGFSVFDDEIMASKIKALFKQFTNVFMLLPYEDSNKSLTVMTQRFLARENGDSKLLTDESISFMKYLLQHPLNKELSKHTFYCEDSSTDDIARKIISISELKV